MTMYQPRGQYRQVADVIRRAIHEGKYPRGSMLPREDQLASELGVNRTTINRALGILEAEGLTRAVRGQGTYVTEIPPIQRNAVARYSKDARERANGRGAFDAEIRRLGMTPRSDVRVSRVKPSERVAALLNVNQAEESVVVRARRMYANDTPVQLADSYIPLNIAEGTVLEEQDTGPGGMVSRMADLGYRQTRISEQITVRPPTPDEARFLNLTEDQRVYDVTHVATAADGQPVEVCLHTMPTHLWILDYDWHADPV